MDVCAMHAAPFNNWNHVIPLFILNWTVRVPVRARLVCYVTQLCYCDYNKLYTFAVHVTCCMLSSACQLWTLLSYSFNIHHNDVVIICSLSFLIIRIIWELQLIFFSVTDCLTPWRGWVSMFFMILIGDTFKVVQASFQIWVQEVVMLVYWIKMY